MITGNRFFPAKRNPVPSIENANYTGLLPVAVWHNIFQYLDCSTVYSIRICDRFLNAAVIEYLKIPNIHINTNMYVEHPGMWPSFHSATQSSFDYEKQEYWRKNFSALQAYWEALSELYLIAKEKAGNTPAKLHAEILNTGIITSEVVLEKLRVFQSQTAKKIPQPSEIRISVNDIQTDFVDLNGDDTHGLCPHGSRGRNLFKKAISTFAITGGVPVLMALGFSIASLCDNSESRTTVWGICAFVSILLTFGSIAASIVYLCKMDSARYRDSVDQIKSYALQEVTRVNNSSPQQSDLISFLNYVLGIYGVCTETWGKTNPEVILKITSWFLTLLDIANSGTPEDQNLAASPKLQAINAEINSYLESFMEQFHDEASSVNLLQQIRVKLTEINNKVNCSKKTAEKVERIPNEKDEAETAELVVSLAAY